MTDEASVSVRTNGYDPRCKSCNDPNHEQYDLEYFSGVITKSEYARRVGCSIPSVTRHLDNHVPKDLAVANNVQAVAKAESLLEDLRALRERATRILEKAEKAGDMKTALMGIREARSCIELLARVEGQLNDRPQITIINNPEWVELRTLILYALEPYKEAREAVVNAIRK